VCSNHQRVGELGRPCLPRTQEIGGSNPPALTNSRRCREPSDCIRVRRGAHSCGWSAERQNNAVLTARDLGGSGRSDPCATRHLRSQLIGSGAVPSNPREAASPSVSMHARNSSVVEGRSHTPRQPQVRSLLPRLGFAGLAKWEGNGSWPRHEAVRSRQPVPGV
jgi:hypothetical protein